MGKKVIWKFELPLTDGGDILMPDGAVLLSVQMQSGVPVLWAIVDPTGEPKARRFCFIGTGHNFNDVNLIFVGTVQQTPFVWHLFEIL
jgi:hypothetical protein